MSQLCRRSASAEPIVNARDVASSVALAHALVEAEIGPICGARAADAGRVDEAMFPRVLVRGIDEWRRYTTAGVR